MLEVRINKRLWIRSDNLSFILSERKKVKDEDSERKGEHYYSDLGYFGSLEHLFDYVIKNELVNSDCESFEEVVDHITKLKKQIKKALSGIKEQCELEGLLRRK